MILKGKNDGKLYSIFRKDESPLAYYDNFVDTTTGVLGPNETKRISGASTFSDNMAISPTIQGI